MTLTNSTLEYLAERGVDRVKYLPKYLIHAKKVWQHLFTKTIYCVQEEWMPMKIGTPYNYVDVPQGTSRLFSASVTDKNNKTYPLYFNFDTNVTPKPKVAKCACGKCSCTGGLCDDVTALTKITTLLFTINGVNYNQYTWVKVCPNGDITLYKEIPTKKYNNFTGDGGAYNNDYSNDYLLAHPPFTDYTIVTEKFQETLCNIQVEPCGCPTNTVSNEQLFMQYCGCYLPDWYERKNRYYDIFLPQINSNELGSIKISDDGTKIYYIPQNYYLQQQVVPDFMLISFQTTGIDCNTEVDVPEYAAEAFSYGLDYYSKRFNGVYNQMEKRESKYRWVEAQNELTIFLNPISLENLSKIQDAEIIW
jgi:hypothetical protein